MVRLYARESRGSIGFERCQPLWGRRKGINFWLGFIISILLTVLVGVIVVAVEKDKVTGRRGFVTWN